MWCTNLIICRAETSKLWDSDETQHTVAFYRSLRCLLTKTNSVTRERITILFWKYMYNMWPLNIYNGPLWCVRRCSVVVDLLFYVPPIVCWGSVFVFVWYVWPYALSSFAIILTRKRELVALLVLSLGCLFTVNVLWLFLTVLWFGLKFLIVFFPDHTHLLFIVCIIL